MDNDETLHWINSVLIGLDQMENEEGRKIIEQCGRKCAISHDLPEEAKEIRAEVKDKEDFVLLFNTYKERVYNTPRLYKEGNVIYLEYHKCGCPIVNSGKINDPFFCNCTRGYTKERFENLFGKPVEVSLLKSILNGDEICKQAITVVE